MTKGNEWKPLTEEERKKLGIPEPLNPGPVLPLEKFLYGEKARTRLEKNREERRKAMLRYVGGDPEEDD